jgi:two-component system LytT family response regulator
LVPTPSAELTNTGLRKPENWNAAPNEPRSVNTPRVNVWRASFFIDETARSASSMSTPASRYRTCFWVGKFQYTAAGGTGCTLARDVTPNLLRAVIVDDQELARGFLRELLEAHPEIEIAAECSNGFEAVKAIADASPDIAFLDIQMPKLDGFEVLELIQQSQPTPPVVIFVTAYDQYAMRAFDAHAVDYLLKPFSAERFERALERAKSRLGERRLPLEAAREARSPAERPQRVVVKDGTRVHVIPLDKLDYVLSQDDYVELHSGGKTFLKQQTIAALEATLNPAHFVRIHRSAIVNLERVSRIEPYAKESRIAILADGTRLPVSRSGYARLLEAMEPGNRNASG